MVHTRCSQVQIVSRDGSYHMLPAVVAYFVLLSASAVLLTYLLHQHTGRARIYPSVSVRVCVRACMCITGTMERES